MAGLTSEFRIIMGLGKAIGDSTSAEVERRVFDLMHNAVAGFSIGEDGWIPALPQLKGGGQWSDTALSDGRDLVASSVGNVVETITLTAQAGTTESRYTLERQLLEFARLAREFHTTDYQIEPVYLHWRAAQAPGAQFALIYNIDIAQDGDPFAPDEAQVVTISVEREPFWRGIPPGANPKLWSFEARGLLPGRDYNASNLKLWSGSDHLKFETIQNRQEFNPTDYLNTITRNWLTIPAASIPGDAPALCLIDVECLYPYLFIARSTKPASLPVLSGTPARHVQTGALNAGDASTLGTDTTKVSDASANNAALSNGSAATRYYGNVSFATATAMTSRLTWGGASPVLNQNAMRGKYVFFARVAQTNGAAGDIKVRLQVQTVGAAAQTTETLPTVPTVAVGGLGAWQLLYLGTMTIPFGLDAINGVDGKGLMNAIAAEHSLLFVLQAQRTTGAGTLQVLDLIMLPYDETMVEFVNPAATNSFHAALDSTGYLARGKGDVGSAAYVIVANAVSFGQIIGEYLGPAIMLQPGVDNRLYFFNAIPGSNTNTSISGSLNVRVNIVPRWSGARDA